jgi:hypothetical protein
MIAVFTVLLVLAMSLVIIRVATIGLTLTGLSQDLAEFQALSAFTRSGFTTAESEDIVNHPVRRRVVMHLMLMGNAGVVIAMASLMLSFLNTRQQENWYSEVWFRASVLAAGVLTLYLIASSKLIEQVMWRVTRWALDHYTRIDIHDYTGLLRLAHAYAVWEMKVHEGDWLANRSLAELELPREGILVLGIERAGGSYVGAPRGNAQVEAGDSLILYGRQETLSDLYSRRAGMLGNMHHVIAVTRQLDVLDEEKELDHNTEP